MSTRSRSRSWIVATTALALLVAACGSGGSESTAVPDDQASPADVQSESLAADVVDGEPEALAATDDGEASGPMFPFTGRPAA
ncbi:MAG: hypothetical protein OEZ14_13195, partial [Acidimicrobiia bacterium]|nr:hypothetical protein [Acidimicrobiia bacterium]